MTDRLAEVNQRLNELGIPTTSLGDRTPAIPSPMIPSPAAKPGPSAETEFLTKRQYGQLTPPPEQLGTAARAFKNLKMGVQQGIVNELEAVDGLARIVSSVTGMDKPTAMKRAADWMRPTEEDLQQGGNTLLDKVTRGIGQAVPFIIEMAVGTKGIGLGLQALKAPAAIKVGSTAFTQGQRLLKAAEVARAAGMAKAARKTLHGTLGLAEPIAFGTYGLTHEALSPDATLGSIIKRTALDTAMGTALPLSHGLPPVARTVAPAAIGGLATAIEGGSLEDITASALTMGALTMGPKAIRVGKRLLVGEKPTPPTPTIPKPEVSEEAHIAAGNVLGGALERLKYEPASVAKWSPWQRQEMLRYTMMGAKEGESPKPFRGVTFSDTTGMLTIPFGKYKVEIPRENPKAPKSKITGAPAGGVKQTTGPNLADPTERKLWMENMPEYQLIFEEANAGDPALKTELQKEMARREAGRRRAAGTEPYTQAYGPWAKAMAYIEETHKGKKSISARELTNIITDNLKANDPLIEPGQEANFLSWFAKDSGWNITAEVEKTPLEVMGEVQGKPKTAAQEYQDLMMQIEGAKTKTAAQMAAAKGQAKPTTVEKPIAEVAQSLGLTKDPSGHWADANGDLYTDEKVRQMEATKVTPQPPATVIPGGTTITGEPPATVIPGTTTKGPAVKIKAKGKGRAKKELAPGYEYAIEEGEVEPGGAPPKKETAKERLQRVNEQLKSMGIAIETRGEGIVTKVGDIEITEGGPKAYREWKKTHPTKEEEVRTISDLMRGVFRTREGAIQTLRSQGLDPEDFFLEDVSEIMGLPGATKIKLRDEPMGSAESPLQRAKRMREEADEFLRRQKEEEELGGPEIGTREGARAAQKEALGTVLKKSVRPGVSTSTRGGLRGRLTEPMGSAADWSQYLKRPEGTEPLKSKAEVIKEEAPVELEAIELTPEILSRVELEAKRRGFPIRIDDLTYAKETGPGRILKKGEVVKEKFGVIRKEADIQEATQKLIRFRPTPFGELVVAQEGVGTYKLGRIGTAAPATEIPKANRYTVESVVKLPLPNADTAFDLGQSLRKQNNLEAAIALWNRYLEGNNRFLQLDPADRRNVHAIEEMLENNLRKEAVESYLGSPKQESLLKSDISRKLLEEANRRANIGELSETMGELGRDWIAESVAMQKQYPQMSDTQIFENIRKSVSVEKARREIPFKTRAEEARPGGIINLLLKGARNAVPTTDIEHRNTLINKILEMSEDIEVAGGEDPRWLKWNRRQLHEFSDDALERILQYNILPRPFEVFIPQLKGGQKLEAIKARIQPETKVGGKWTDPYQIRLSLIKDGWGDLVDIVDWDRVLELRDKGVKLIDFIPDRKAGRPIEEVGLDDPELQRASGMDPNEMSVFDKTLLRTGWKGLNPEQLVGPLVRIVFENRSMSFRDAIGKINKGKMIPALPAEHMSYIYQGFNPPKFKLGGFKSDSLAKFVTQKIADAVGVPGEPEKVQASYPKNTELEIINEVFAGLDPEMVDLPEQKIALQNFKDMIITNFEEFHKPKIGRTKQTEAMPFAEAVGEAFAKAYAAIISPRTKNEARIEMANTIKEQLIKSMQELYRRGSLNITGEEKLIPAPERTDMTAARKAKRALGITQAEGSEDILQPGGPPWGSESQGDKVQNVMKRLEKEGVLPPPPKEATDADRLVNEANKATDTFRDYRNIIDLMAKNAGEFEELAKEIGRLAVTKTAMKDAAPETLAPVDEKLQQLLQRREQLVTDNDYLGILKDFFSRTGKPYTGTETYLEEPLSPESHGLEGTVISKASPKGATFYVIQGPDGTPIKFGQPGHRIYAKADVAFRRTKGEVTSWEMPEGTDPRVEDALYNDILERFMWRDKPIAITNATGIAEAVVRRRPSSKYAALKNRPDFDIFKLLPEDSAAYREQKKKYHDQLIAAAISVEGKKYGPLTREKKMEFLRRAQSLSDSTIGYDLEMLSKDPASMGILDPILAAGQVQYMPLLERIGDPTQSRIAPVAYVGNLALQTELSIANFMKQYGEMAEQSLGAFRTDPVAKQKIFRHLIAQAEPVVKAKNPDWVLKDSPENTELLRGAEGYTRIMNDLADLFSLEKKGLYRKNYVTLSYDLGKLWDNLYAEKFRKIQQPHQAPDSILSKIAPEDFYTLRDLAMSGKAWGKMDPVEKTAIMNKFFHNNIAYAEWESLPDAIRARIPKQKFIKYFQHRTDDAANLINFANEDIWDVLTNYITTVVHDGVISDFFLPKARAIVNPMPAAGVNERFSVRGYLDSYIKQVAGFGRKTPGTMFLDSLFQSMNKWFGAQVFPESGMAAEAANLYQQLLYRGALGIDTAVRNLTQSIYTVAELGPNVWMKGLIDYVGNKWKNTKEWQKFDEHRGLIEEFYEGRLEMLRKSEPTLYDKWRKLDRRVTSIALHPMHVTENINRGIAYFGGLVEARNLGLDPDTAHLVGLNGAQKYAHPYEMAEAEWHATKRMYESQFGYGITHTPPMFTGPAAAWFKPFLTFPTRSLNFASNLGKGALGIERWGEAAYKEPWVKMLGAKAPEGKSWLAGPQGQFARFLALTGFMVYAPQLIASTLGIDTGYLWGKGLFPNNFTPMWMQMMEDVYTGVFGGLGREVPPTAKDRLESLRRLKNNAFMLMIPQWRFMKKGANVMENIEKGYYGMGPKDLPAHETTIAREIINLLGFPPYTKDAKQLVWDAYRQRGDVWTMKAETLKEAADYMEHGQYDKASKLIANFHKRYRVRIREADIKDYLRYKNSTTAYEEAEKNLPEPMRQEWGPKFREAKEKHLPRGASRGRSLWTNTERPSALAQPQPQAPTPPSMEQMELLSRMIQGGGMLPPPGYFEE